MRVFLSYAITGENVEQVGARLRRIRDLLVSYGHEVYCFHFDPARQYDMAPAECLRYAVKQCLPLYDVLFVINTSERRSEGMLIEIGVAIERGMHIIYAQHVTANGKTYVSDLANEVFIWDTESALLTQAENWAQKGEKNDRHTKPAKRYVQA